MAIAASDLPAFSRLLDEALDLEPGRLVDRFAKLGVGSEHLAPPLRGLAAPDGNDGAVYAGELIGPYRLLRELGRGGMGAVWLAERADGSFKRKVALKLPRLAWDAGLARRMARERAIGAVLEHPHIARLYDAGVDDRGRPFLALEYIDGQPIDIWCTAHALPLHERLQLVVQVARALAYAHGRLVVHRDLKPSNVLIGPDGRAHLLDFGIAELLDEDEADGGVTKEHGRAMTPQYASPEQVCGDTITVASDIYSLGALLYELATAQRPYVLTRQTIGAMEKAILGGEPAPASSRVADKQAARELRGEVDAILAKALRRDPAQRYATAEAFAADIERHLNGELVLARQDSLRYRAAKAWRRHRFALGTAAAVLVALFAAAMISIAQAQRANLEADRARQVKEFMVDILGTRSSPDGSLGQMPGHALL